MNSGVGDGHHRHGMHPLLSHLHREVDIYFLRGCGADVTLEVEGTESTSHTRVAESKKRTKVAKIATLINPKLVNRIQNVMYSSKLWETLQPMDFAVCVCVCAPRVETSDSN